MNCFMCQNPIKKGNEDKYQSVTHGYYRNKCNGKYNFCSMGCKKEFDNTKKCKHCHYTKDLVQVDDYMLCYKGPCNELSCYEKHFDTQFYNGCAICSSEEHSLNVLEKDHDKIFLCDNCYGIFDIIFHHFSQKD